MTLSRLKGGPNRFRSFVRFNLKSVKEDWYARIHTKAHTGGEIRGQLVKQ